MSVQDLTTEYNLRLREILDWYHLVVDAAKEQKRSALEDLETWFTETYDGLKEKVK